MPAGRPAPARGAAAVLLGLLGVFPECATAQVPGDTVVIMAGPHYEAGRFRSLVHGHNWRALWLEPVRVPVLDPHSFAGGLTPERRGGGNQSITLHMIDAAGRGWIFRSTDKFLHRALPADVRDVPAGFIVADHISMLHPGGAFVLPPLLEAAGILHVRPQLFVMPDDAALGEFRADFAGMLGALEPKPDEGPDDTPGFAGSRSIKGSEGLLEDLLESHAHRVDEREFLRARLIDFLVGDTDRGTDQWRWARFGEPPFYTWRPIPADRDWSLVKADGLLARLARDWYGKLARFGPRYPPVDALTFSSHVLDRRLLTRLTRQDVDAEAERLQLALTDDVLAAAVAAQPPAYAAVAGPDIEAALRARRDRLPQVASAFYRWLAGEVDAHGTDEPDLADIQRIPGGAVRITIQPLHRAVAVHGGNGNGLAAAPFYQRTFLPGETREIRVHLHGGADVARVTGTAGGPITVRVIGGEGDDVLEDYVGGARFYDDAGDNRVLRSAGTRFNEKPWSPPDPPEGLRTGRDWAPDWGRERSIDPIADIHGRSGLLIGAGFNDRRYGFRRIPYHWDLDVDALYAPATGRGVVRFGLDYTLPNSRRSARLDARATGLERIRFHGWGNATPGVDDEASRIPLTKLDMQALLRWRIGPLPGRPDVVATTVPEDSTSAGTPWTPPTPRRTTGFFEVGADVAWTDASVPAGVPLSGEPVTSVGARAALELRRTDRSDVPRRGFRLKAGAAAYPLVTGPAEAYVTASATGAVYLPLVSDGPHMALRAGASRAFGAYPFLAAAYLGGRNDLRGMPSDRYAGDAAVHGTAELRVPLDHLVLLFRTEAGAFVFGDAGRVWHDGTSPGGWHTGVGAGLWLSTLGRSISVAVARGEGTRLHAWLGLPF